MISKILSMATVGGTIASIGVLHRCLLKTAEVLVLTIIFCFSFFFVLTSLIVAVYFCLVLYGVAPSHAALELAILLLAISAATCGMAWCRLRKRSGGLHNELTTHKKIPPDLHGIADAFINGFLKRKR